MEQKETRLIFSGKGELRCSLHFYFSCFHLVLFQVCSGGGRLHLVAFTATQCHTIWRYQKVCVEIRYVQCPPEPEFCKNQHDAFILGRMDSSMVISSCHSLFECSVQQASHLMTFRRMSKQGTQQPGQRFALVSIATYTLERVG